jgi:hypothetical protein
MLLLWAANQSAVRPENEWTGETITVSHGSWVPPAPVIPEVEDFDAPDVIDTTKPKAIQYAVSSIRDFEWKGELLSCRAESPRSLRLDGGGDARWTASTSDVSVLATLCDDVEEWGDLKTGRLKIIDRAIHPVIDGHLAPAYVLRGEAQVKDGLIHLTGLTPPQGLFPTRILGQGERKDYLNGRGMMPGLGSYQSLGFTWTGNPGDIQFTDNGVTGGRALRIRGDKRTAKLTISALIVEGEGTTNQQVTVRSGAFLNIPQSAVERTDAMLTEVFVGNTRVSPPEGRPFDPDHVVQIDDNMPRGEFARDPYVSAALLPVPPYTALVKTTILPHSTTDWTEVSNVTVFRRDSLSTGVERDLVDHQLILIRESQNRPGKSSWSLPVERRESSGVSEVGVWRAEDEQPLPDALSAIDSRDDGPDPPWVRAGWVAVVGHRRGTVRTALRLGPDDVLSHDGWTHDPGAQKSELRGLTDRGNAYWRVSHVETDTSRTEGHVIEVQARAPNDQDLLSLAEWTKARLAQVAQPQETTRLVVSGYWGRRIAVGDSFRVVLMDGFLRLDRLMRVSQWAMDDETDTCVLDVGNDERED